MADHRGAPRARRTQALLPTLTRRALLEAGVALPAVSLAAPLMGYAASTALELERFLFDPRFAEAFDVAQAVGGGGVPLAPVADDLADFWYRELDLSWREGPMALAGVTLTEALFVLETLAMDRQMRVVYRGEHSRVEDGRIRHKLAGPATMLERFASLPETAAWEGELARALTECPLGRPETVELELVTSAPGLSTRDMPLTSWIIAPRAAVAVTIRS